MPNESLNALRERRIAPDQGIGLILDDLERHPLPPWGAGADWWAAAARGVAFVTFAYDIDGVSMEIAKYGECLRALFSERGHDLPVHCIGGTFRDKADHVLPADWKRCELPGADGWAKWNGGRWFERLFAHDLEEGSPESIELAAEIWKQAGTLADRICEYADAEGIGLLFPVNVNSNPGNVAMALATVLASETSGRPVLNNNHDFYWEGGRPPSERAPDEPPGPRDHFFRNIENRPFFALLRRLYPWDGRRWVQVNINPEQSRRLVGEFGFLPERVLEIGTSIEAAFFDACPPEERLRHRRRMGIVLGRGTTPVEAVPVERFLAGTGEWMTDQHPVLCGAAPGLTLDPEAPGTLWLLQPTRIIGRKRIGRDWDLIGALLRHAPFRDAFERRADLTLTLHCTGPVPIEHRADLEEVLAAYRRALAGLPDEIAHRVFLAFSVGNQDHPVLTEEGLGELVIADFYKLTDLVLFPSETEGRGLPIPESAAAGVPIVCSRYDPVDVFEEVVGASLPPEHRILYETFPEGEFDEALLDRVSALLLDPASYDRERAHNRAAVRRRYAPEALTRGLGTVLERLEQLSR